MKAIAVIPTYNEAENIIPLVRDVVGRSPSLEALVVDDDSPDGTAGLVAEEERRNPRVHLMLRRGDRGRGSAGLDGFRRALAMGADRVAEMDADFSHDPRHLPALLDAAETADLVIGSRYIPGGGDSGRGIGRKAVSAFARRYLRWALGVEVRDPTSGYRCFRREALARLLEEPIGARDPFIIAETLFLCSRMGMRIAEVPIQFRRRRAGQSKLGVQTLVGYLWRAARLRLKSG